VRATRNASNSGARFPRERIVGRDYTIRASISFLCATAGCDRSRSPSESLALRRNEDDERRQRSRIAAMARGDHAFFGAGASPDDVARFLIARQTEPQENDDSA
jgi:hypothetical protein